MRVRTKKITIGLVALAVAVLFAIPQAFAAKASFDQPPGEPPYGLAVHGKAGGTKLYGTMEIEFINPDGSDADVRAVARLRKGNVVKVFYANVGTVNYSDPQVLQAAVADAMKVQVLQFFFPGEAGLCTWLKGVSELGTSDLYDENGYQLRFEMLDIEVAVNACQ